MKNNHNHFMSEAIRLSSENIDCGGGPFGAVIVKDGEIIARGTNSVTNSNDPTAHAEVNAIRLASEKLKTFSLEGCTIYTSCEPCPMCLGAIYWARINNVFYGNTKADARNIGFDDSFIYEELELPLNNRKVAFTQLLHDDSIKVFKKWEADENKTKY